MIEEAAGQKREYVAITASLPDEHKEAVLALLTQEHLC